jgi:hypothetical protein
MEIEHNIPMPPRGRPRSYPFDKMARGDSLFAEGEAGVRLYIAIRAYAKKQRAQGDDWTASGRRVGTGWRVWRDPIPTGL